MALTNTELKMLKALRGHRRAEERLFLAEGVRVLEEALRFRVRPRAVYVTLGQLTERGEELIRQFAGRGIEVRRIPARQLEAISDAESSQGVLGVIERPVVTLEKLDVSAHRTVLVCDGIGDPGNLGTLCRSALAFGFGLMVQCGEAVDAYAPKVVRSSAGAIFGLTVAVADAPLVIGWLKRNEYQLYAADQRGESMGAISSRPTAESRVALAVGSEAHGLSAEFRKAADSRIKVAHNATVESLNAAVAGSILMKELYDLCHT